jgi:glycosyltransferase involved in cell wall biosynthesis
MKPVCCPSVSILMPVRNEERFLPMALRSLAAQTLKAWELVVVDDGSTDSTPHILAEAADNDPRIRVVKSSGQGLVSALNTGLSVCRAPLVARMDGDDIAHPDRLAEQAAFLSAHDTVGLVACSFRHFPRHQVGMGMMGYEQWQNQLLAHEAILADLFVESPFVHPSVMFRRQAVESVGGYRDMGWAEDYDLWLRLAAAGTRFARLARTLFFWRERPDRTTRSSEAYTPVAFRLCKLHHLQNSFLKGEHEVILAGAGLEGRAWYRVLRDAGVHVACWVDVDPRKVGRLLHGAPVLATDQVPPTGVKVLMTVGARGARTAVRHWALQAGFREGSTAICVA